MITREDALHQPCTTCGEGPGFKCVSSTGRLIPLSDMHANRWRSAQRAAQALPEDNETFALRCTRCIDRVDLLDPQLMWMFKLMYSEDSFLGCNTPLLPNALRVAFYMPRRVDAVPGSGIPHKRTFRTHTQLTKDMTDNDIMVALLALAMTTVEHEVLELFHVDGKALLSPHNQYTDDFKFRVRERQHRAELTYTLGTIQRG